MRNQPALDVLLSKAENKYVVVLAAARRARNMVEEANHPGKDAPVKPVGAALNELANDQLIYYLKGNNNGETG